MVGHVHDMRYVLVVVPAEMVDVPAADQDIGLSGDFKQRYKHGQLGHDKTSEHLKCAPCVKRLMVVGV